MPSLHEFQASFGAAVRGAPADGLNVTADGAIPVERRMDVYRNNVHASLIDALESAFPIVARLVGRDFFRAMGREYLRSHMPGRGTLVGFGDRLPGFLAGFGPASSLPYLADVARLELAWLAAYHAADCPVIAAATLADIPPDEIADLCFDLHPAVHVVTSAYPVWSIWRENQDGGNPGAVDFGRGGETAMLLRPVLTVEMHRVDPGVATLVEALAGGQTLGASAAEALAASAEFDLGRTLHLFLSGGAFARVHRRQHR